MRQSSYNVRRNNWPPLPEQCCFQPCFYQDIQVDIPLEFQKIVRHLYYLWICKYALTIIRWLLVCHIGMQFSIANNHLRSSSNTKYFVHGSDNHWQLMLHIVIVHSLHSVLSNICDKEKTLTGKYIRFSYCKAELSNSLTIFCNSIWLVKALYVLIWSFQSIFGKFLLSQVLYSCIMHLHCLWKQRLIFEIPCYVFQCVRILPGLPDLNAYK